MQLSHPAQFEIRVARDSRVAALEFVSELELALADRALRAAENAHLQHESKEPPVLERPKNPYTLPPDQRLDLPGAPTKWGIHSLHVPARAQYARGADAMIDNGDPIQRE